MDASLTTAARVRALRPARPRLRAPRGGPTTPSWPASAPATNGPSSWSSTAITAACSPSAGACSASDEEAEDALQHTFMAAYRALRASDRPIHLKAWLYTIARNRCLSILRARREQVALDDGPRRRPTAWPPTSTGAPSCAACWPTSQQLPDEQRAALVLFELGDHSHDEIAEVLGVRRDKVKALVFQARESLAGWRRARETPCVEIREQLATRCAARALRARHAAPPRRALRGLRAFETEVRRQRSAMALLLPVVPTAGLKAAVLGAAGIGAGTGGWGRRGSLAGLGRRREGRGGQDDAVRRGGRQRRQRGLRRGARGADARRTRGRSRRCVAPLAPRPAGARERGRPRGAQAARRRSRSRTRAAAPAVAAAPAHAAAPIARRTAGATIAATDSRAHGPAPSGGSAAMGGDGDSQQHGSTMAAGATDPRDAAARSSARLRPARPLRPRHGSADAQRLHPARQSARGGSTHGAGRHQTAPRSRRHRGRALPRRAGRPCARGPLRGGLRVARRVAPGGRLAAVEAVAAEDHPHGEQQDAQVQAPGAVLDVPEVELDALVPRQLGAAVDLRPAGDARA